MSLPRDRSDLSISEFLRTRRVRVPVGSGPAGIEGLHHADVAPAVPISEDGYLLTAAHALGGNPMTQYFFN